MSDWTAAELDAVDGADELDVRTRRADGTLRNPRIVWVVRLDDDLDAVYRAKYGRYPGPTAHITAAAARDTTLRLDPR